MSATERVAAFGSRSTISGWAAISPSRKSSRVAHHRVHRRLDYPASLGLDRRPTDSMSGWDLSDAIAMCTATPRDGRLANSTFDRTAGSHSLAARPVNVNVIRTEMRLAA